MSFWYIVRRKHTHVVFFRHMYNKRKKMFFFLKEYVFIFYGHIFWTVAKFFFEKLPKYVPYLLLVVCGIVQFVTVVHFVLFFFLLNGHNSAKWIFKRSAGNVIYEITSPKSHFNCITCQQGIADTLYQQVDPNIFEKKIR